MNKIIKALLIFSIFTVSQSSYSETDSTYETQLKNTLITLNALIKEELLGLEDIKRLRKELAINKALYKSNNGSNYKYLEPAQIYMEALKLSLNKSYEIESTAKSEYKKCREDSNYSDFSSSTCRLMTMIAIAPDYKNRDKILQHAYAISSEILNSKSKFLTKVEVTSISEKKNNEILEAITLQKNKEYEAALKETFTKLGYGNRESNILNSIEEFNKNNDEQINYENLEEAGLVTSRKLQNTIENIKTNLIELGHFSGSMRNFTEYKLYEALEKYKSKDYRKNTPFLKILEDTNNSVEEYRSSKETQRAIEEKNLQKKRDNFKQLQKILVRYDLYNGAIDGIYGKNTQVAIKILGIENEVLKLLDQDKFLDIDELVKERVELKEVEDKKELLWKDKIIGKVKSHWVNPLNSDQTMSCQVRIRLIPTGDIVPGSVTILKSSGNKQFDRSVEQAVYKADPLPVPSGEEFEEFRRFYFKFTSP